MVIGTGTNQNVLVSVLYIIVIPWVPPVRGDNPRALASGLSHVQIDTLLSSRYGEHNANTYTTYRRKRTKKTKTK